MRTASRNVVRSGAVGPDPITPRSSPPTSERMRVSTEAGVAAASRPPLIAERCLRTALTSAIVAPAKALAHGARHGDGGLARADGNYPSNTTQVIQAAVHAQGLTSQRQRPPNGEGGGGRVERGQQDATQRCPDE